jgi:ribosomal protein L32
MHPEIENLINMALADGEVTEKERAIILRKAESLGIDKDEVEMILEAKLHQLQKRANESKKENVNKCPSCGEIIHGLSQVCSSCGYVLNKSTIAGQNSKGLSDSIHQLENLIIDVKSSPKPSFGDRLKIIVLTYFSLGLYLIYRKFAHKKGDSFENLVAKCEKEARLIKVHYGEDKKVKLLLDELNGEIDKIGKERKKLSLRTNLGCFGLVIVFIGLYAIMTIWSFNYSKEYLKDANSSNIDSLISIGQIEKAKQEAFKITPDFKKDDAFDKIFIYEIDQHIQKNEIELAKNKANSIKSKYKREECMDKIITIEVNKLIEENKIDDARNKAQLINNQYDRKEMLDKIDSIK